MDSSRYQFIAGVLGTDGAQALQKAGELHPNLETAILPRCIISWIKVYESGYDGSIPGIEGSELVFKKSEKGFDGRIVFGEHSYSFKEASEYHLAACVVTALGSEEEDISDAAKSVEIARLGKSVDLLIKAFAVSNSGYSISVSPPRISVKKKKKKKKPPTDGYSSSSYLIGTSNPAPAAPAPSAPTGGVSMTMSEGLPKKIAKMVVDKIKKSGEHQSADAKHSLQSIRKAAQDMSKKAKDTAAGTGGTAKPTAPEPPAAPTATQSATIKPIANVTPQASKGTSAKPKATTMKLSEKFANSYSCGECGTKPFKDSRFVGCICVRDLCKSVKSILREQAFTLDLSKLDPEEAITVMESLNGRK